MKKLVLSLGLIALASPALAEVFPDKALELVVPFAPGGGSDVSARIFSSCLEKQLPVKVLIKNITGARGKIGEVEVRDARPDGYKLLWSHQGMDMGLATKRSDYNYEAFAAVASSVAMNYGIFAGKATGVTDLESLKAAVKAKPGENTIGVALNGFSHFAALDFLEAAGIDATQLKSIPMSGDKPRIVASIQGVLTLVPTAVGAAAPYVDSGDMSTIAIMTDKPDTRLANAPTSATLGIDSNFAMYFTTFAPKGTPQDRIDVLADAWLKAAADPDCQAKLAEQSMTVDAEKGAELQKTLDARYARIVALTEKFGLIDKE